MSDADMSFFSRILNVVLVFTTIGSMYFRFKVPKGSITAKELLDLLEEKNKEIDKLHTEISVWRNHHERLANKK